MRSFDYGLFLDPEVPFIGVIPDRIVSCDCGDKECLEIKCPLSISHLSPTDSTPYSRLKYLVNDLDGNVSLNQNHDYYTQCLTQMGVTGFCQVIFLLGLHMVSLWKKLS